LPVSPRLDTYLEPVHTFRISLLRLCVSLGLPCVLLLTTLPDAWAQQLKIGFVNTQRIFRDAPIALQATRKLEREFARRDQELQSMSQQLQVLQDSLEKNSATLTEVDRRRQERKLAEMKHNFNRKRRIFREDLNLRQNEENSALIERANQIVQRIAVAEHFDLILQDVVWVNPNLDITDRVIQALSGDEAPPTKTQLQSPPQQQQ